MTCIQALIMLICFLCITKRYQLSMLNPYLRSPVNDITRLYYNSSNIPIVVFYMQLLDFIDSTNWQKSNIHNSFNYSWMTNSRIVYLVKWLIVSDKSQPVRCQNPGVGSSFQCLSYQKRLKEKLDWVWGGGGVGDKAECFKYETVIHIEWESAQILHTNNSSR